MPKDNRRYPPRPILGVGALILRRNKILLVERGKQPLKGYWSLPGGVLELGERLEDGIRREVREETGLEIEPLKVAEIFERIMLDKRGRTEYHYVLVDYLCKVIAGNAAPSDDVSDVAWVSLRNLPEYKLTEGSLAVIEKAFQMRAARR